MRKAILIDDEPHSLELIRIMLRDYCEGIEVIGEAQTVSKGIELVREKSPDLVFLDVELSGGDGFEVIEAFENPSFEVVMISGHNPELLRSFDFAALAYLTKPLVLQEFQQLVASLPQIPIQEEQISLVKDLQDPESEGPGRIILTDGGKYSSIEIQKIAYIEAQRAYSRIVLETGGEHFATYSLGHYEKLLPLATFFRIHKSYLLNMTLVDKFDTGRTGNVHLTNQISLPIAARRKAEFIRHLQSLKQG